jgi:hypothetical protein
VAVGFTETQVGGGTVGEADGDGFHIFQLVPGQVSVSITKRYNSLTLALCKVDGKTHSSKVVQDDFHRGLRFGHDGAGIRVGNRIHDVIRIRHLVKGDGDVVIFPRVVLVFTFEDEAVLFQVAASVVQNGPKRNNENQVC